MSRYQAVSVCRHHLNTENRHTRLLGVRGITALLTTRTERAAHIVLAYSSFKRQP